VIRTTLATLAIAALLSGCGGSGLRHDLAATGDSIGKIHGGTIDFSMLVTPRAKGAENPFGFKLNGPFSFGDVPTAHVAYTQIANGHSATSTLALGKSGGIVEQSGTRRTLTAAHLDELRKAAARIRQGSSIDVGSWLKSAASCGARCAHGDLDVAAAANTLLALSGGHGTLDSDNAKRLADATRNATYRIEWTPKHVLRDLKLHVDLGFDVPEKLRAALGDLVGAVFDLHLGLTNVQT
jgi:hypothetical protein